MKQQLIIIGARGFGREVYFLAQECIAAGTLDIAIKGFLDDKADALDSYCGYPPIIDSVEKYQIEPDDVFICALGDVRYKKQYAEMIIDKGGRFISLIHPSATIKHNATVASGCIILDQALISVDVTIEDFVTVQPFSVIGHDARIGKWSHLNTYSFMGGFATLAQGATLHTGAKIVPHKKVGEWATVGAGSVVIRNVPANISVFGIPATKIDF